MIVHTVKVSWRVLSNSDMLDGPSAQEQQQELARAAMLMGIDLKEFYELSQSVQVESRVATLSVNPHPIID